MNCLVASLNKELFILYLEIVCKKDEKTGQEEYQSKHSSK